MRRLGVLIACILSLALVGCSGIPTSGPIQEVPMSAQPPGIDIAPEPPQAGITQDQLIEGFLQAMADPEGDFAVARQYLSQEADASWKPAGAVIYEGAVAGDPSKAYLEGSEVGTLDSAGHFEPALSSLHHDFGIVEENGQWRIGLPPRGLLLSRYIFERYYTQVSLYYMSVAGSHVIPDPIHLPEQQVTPTRIVKALLSGPSASISRAVSNALPVTAALGPNEASIDSSGVVTVDLKGLSSTLGEEARRHIGAQLSWSLTSIPRVTGLVIMRDGVAFTLPDANAQGVLELTTQQGYQVLSRAVPTNELLAIHEGTPGVVAESFEPLARIAGRFSDLAASLDGGNLALIDEARTGLYMGPRNGTITAVTTGLRNLRRPQFVLGNLWVMGEDATGSTALLTITEDGHLTRVGVDDTRGGSLQSFAVSPTGSRVALIVTLGGRNTLGIATILPANPTRIVGWRPLSLITDQTRVLTDALSVTWSDDTLLGLIAGVEDQRSIYLAHVDGSQVEDLSPVGGSPQALTALARQGGGPMAVLTDAGAIWRFDARTRWSRLAEQASAIAYAG